MTWCWFDLAFATPSQLGGFLDRMARLAQGNNALARGGIRLPTGVFAGRLGHLHAQALPFAI